MRFKHHLEFEYGLKQIDIAPLIDLVFLLLIFFMLTSGFIAQPGIKINLPKTITGEITKYQNLELVVSGENVVYLGGKVMSKNELKNLLVQVAKRKQAVLIKSDRGASLGKVVGIWNMCRDLGVYQVNIVTNQE